MLSISHRVAAHQTAGPSSDPRFWDTQDGIGELQKPPLGLSGVVVRKFSFPPYKPTCFSQELWEASDRPSLQKRKVAQRHGDLPADTQPGW